MNGFNKFIKFIVPPKDGDSATPWRWAIFICVIFLILNAAAGRGIVVGYGAYAAHRDVQVILELQYAETIRNLHNEVCRILPLRNAVVEHALEDYQIRYKKLTGRRYPHGAC